MELKEILGYILLSGVAAFIWVAFLVGLVLLWKAFK